MSTYQPLITPTTSDDAWLFAPDADDGAQALRDTCAAKVLDYELHDAFERLPQRMQDAYWAALRGADTEANDREIGRILRGAFKRVVDDAVEMHVARSRNEAELFSGE